MSHIWMSHVTHLSFTMVSVCVADGRNTLQHTATHCNTLQHTATHCNTLQHAATRCNTLQHAAIHCNTLQHAATRCNTLQHTATHCNTLHDSLFTVLAAAPSSAIFCHILPHTAIHCNTLQQRNNLSVTCLTIDLLCRSVELGDNFCSQPPLTRTQPHP